MWHLSFWPIYLIPHHYIYLWHSIDLPFRKLKGNKNPKTKTLLIYVLFHQIRELKLPFFYMVLWISQTQKGMSNSAEPIDKSVGFIPWPDQYIVESWYLLTVFFNLKCAPIWTMKNTCIHKTNHANQSYNQISWKWKFGTCTPLPWLQGRRLGARGHHPGVFLWR